MSSDTNNYHIHWGTLVTLERKFLDTCHVVDSRRTRPSDLNMDSDFDPDSLKKALAQFNERNFTDDFKDCYRKVNVDSNAIAFIVSQVGVNGHEPAASLGSIVQHLSVTESGVSEPSLMQAILFLQNNGFINLKSSDPESSKNQIIEKTQKFATIFKE